MLHSLKRNGAATNDLKSKVMKKITSGKVTEVFNPPVKSLSDKKDYRLIKLPNGLTSLLVQHFIEDDPSKDEDSKADDRKMSESDMSASSQNTDASESDDHGEEEEDDSHKEKMAAVALCIRVGSFFDPTKIQGLSHFLEVCPNIYDEPK